MITFKKIRWKNLLSTGNLFSEIDLSTDNMSLIVGKNGHGKSTILDALTFALFGKPFRKINKPLLVNSINKKNCHVEIEFDTNGKQYKIVRGIKPNIFEIYCNGEMLDQSAAIKDYQDYLEKNILKMNMKSFTQIVILGSASFTPFMQLTPADRRVVIENLLDISIFSVMNVIAKQKFQDNKEAIEKNKFELNSKLEHLEYIKKTIKSLKKSNDDKIEKHRADIADAQSHIDTINKEIQELLITKASILDQIPDVTKLKERHKKLIALQSKIEANKSSAQKNIAFYENNDTCPTCLQNIDNQFKHDSVCSTKEKVVEYDTAMEKMKQEISSCIDSISEAERLLGEEQVIRQDITKKESNIKYYQKIVTDTEKHIDTLTNADSLISENEKEEKITKEKMVELSDKRKELMEERTVIETTIGLLKDGGIKTRIIKQYLPIMNKLINKYLAQMGFFVDFNINENFEETIKSRHRDEFSYQNFSEGEKTRIDLALLFTWRAIAKMKNSASTNLLILDEILDGSLDANGTEEFIKIIKYLTDGTNSFIISHKTDQLVEKFDKVYRFEKIKNFSRLV